MDFGSLFFGETGEQTFKVVNNGPSEIRCSMSFGSKFDMNEPEELEIEEKSVLSTASEDSESVCFYLMLIASECCLMAVHIAPVNSRSSVQSFSFPMSSHHLQSLVQYLVYLVHNR